MLIVLYIYEKDLRPPTCSTRSIVPAHVQTHIYTSRLHDTPSMHREHAPRKTDGPTWRRQGPALVGRDNGWNDRVFHLSSSSYPPVSTAMALYIITCTEQQVVEWHRKELAKRFAILSAFECAFMRSRTQRDRRGRRATSTGMVRPDIKTDVQ